MLRKNEVSYDILFKASKLRPYRNSPKLKMGSTGRYKKVGRYFGARTYSRICWGALYQWMSEGKRFFGIGKTGKSETFRVDWKKWNSKFEFFESNAADTDVSVFYECVGWRSDSLYEDSICVLWKEPEAL